MYRRPVLQQVHDQKEYRARSDCGRLAGGQRRPAQSSPRRSNDERERAQMDDPVRARLLQRPSSTRPAHSARRSLQLQPGRSRQEERDERSEQHCPSGQRHCVLCEYR